MKRDRLYFSFLCLCCFLFCALDVQAQQDYWKGQVKDAVSGEPMIGVSVRVKGTGSGTITDFDGNFTVKASKGDILVISYVGYKTLELLFIILYLLVMINLETKIAYFPIKQCFIGYKYIFVCYIDASQNE
jgi:hypothetical protein